MRSLNPPLIAGGLYGFTAITLGAYVQHRLRPGLSPQNLDSLDTALRYMLLHATMLGALGLHWPFGAARKRLGIAVLSFSLGTLCFSGGIVLDVIVGWATALHAAPGGGILLMLGWLCLSCAGLNRMQDRK